MGATTTTSTQEKALELLGQGLGTEIVASALGVTPSAISQLLSSPDFAEKVSAARFQNLARHNQRDSSYDSLEDKLLEKLDKNIPFMVKPLEILRAIQVINGAKRRGSSAPESITHQQEVVKLTMPTVIMNNFVTNIHNQVVKTGEQSLVTIQSSSMPGLVSAAQSGKIPSLPQQSPMTSQNSGEILDVYPTEQTNGARTG